ncbi:hypothetical protein FRC03_009554 [Tulasnella sp. 419]|nr:hypothetical protein FRC03_009554 [Tulasnella sp. 419]
MDQTAESTNINSGGERVRGRGVREHYGHEVEWAQRHDFLLQHGYQLRPRYRPGWKPSWTTPAPVLKNEDAILQRSRGDIMDAKRLSDDSVVMMKPTPKNSSELLITSLLSSGTLRDEPRNHSVPLLEVLDDPLDPNTALMIFPLLRRANEPEFASVADCIDFIEQTLEGIAFMHENSVAHRDCYAGNVMMDGRALYPKGWHPQQPRRRPDGPLLKGTPKRGSVGGVRYYFIDFGISTHSQDMVTGEAGQVQAPELSETVEYNPYRVDIFILGELYKLLILKEYEDFASVKTLVDMMTKEDPALRPSASECLEIFKTDTNHLTKSQRLRRLRPLNPGWKIVELVKDANYYILERYWALYPSRKALATYKSTSEVGAPTEPERNE